MKTIYELTEAKSASVLPWNDPSVMPERAALYVRTDPRASQFRYAPGAKLLESQFFAYYEPAIGWCDVSKDPWQAVLCRTPYAVDDYPWVEV